MTGPPRRRVSPEERRERRAAVDDPSVVMDAAAAFLATRPRSTEEVRRRLRGAGYRPALVETTVGRLIELGYLDDASFALAWIESRDRSRPRGSAAIRRELALKGVPEDVIRECLQLRDAAARPAGPPGRAGSDGDPGGDADARAADADAARRLLERRRGALEREADARKRHARAYALLARNGFPPDVCASVSRVMAAAPDGRSFEEEG